MVTGARAAHHVLAFNICVFVLQGAGGSAATTSREPTDAERDTLRPGGRGERVDHRGEEQPSAPALMTSPLRDASTQHGTDTPDTPQPPTEVGRLRSVMSQNTHFLDGFVAMRPNGDSIIDLL